MAATASLRAAVRDRPAFAPGHFRQAHEARWTAAAYATMHALLATVPVTWRAPMKAMLFAAVRSAGTDQDAADVIRDAFAACIDRNLEAAR
jgi:N-methylhydantoinase B